MSIIYGIRFKPDGKIYYVGQTVQSAKQRWKQHRNANTILGKTIKMFGDAGMFEMVVLETIEDNGALNEREIFWIAELNTAHPNGLNQNSGGAGGNSSILGRQRASERMRQICAREGYLEKVSPIRKALWQDPEYRAKTLEGMIEAKACPEFRKKMSEHTKARWEKPGHRELVAASTRAEWADPVKKEAKSAAIRRALQARRDDPQKRAETFAKQSAAQTKRWVKASAD